MMWKQRCRVLLAFYMMVLWGGASLAAVQDNYFHGKTVRIIVGFPPGGGVDADARMIARFFSLHIPGNPAVIVQNMSGAAGMVASNWFQQFAKPDGLTLHYASGTILNQQALGVKEVKYDLRSWPVIGSVRRGSAVAMIRKTGLDRLTGPGEPLKIGVRSGDENGNAIFLWGAEFLKWNVRWVQGYQGGGESLLAFERNETDIYPTATLSTLRKLVDQGFIPFVQQGKLTATGSFQRRSEFPDVPVLEELAKDLRTSKVAWQAYVMRAGTDSAGRPFQGASKTPAGVVRVLRESFARMSETTEFKTELKKISGDDAEILPGEEAQHILGQILIVSPPMRDYTNTLMKKYVNR